MKDFAIIASLDLDTAKDVLSVTSKIAPNVEGVKIGVPTLLERGVGFLQEIRSFLDSKPLLVDLKIADIGFRSATSWRGTNVKIMLQLAGSGVTHVTVQGFPGPSSVAEAVSIGKEIGVGVLLLPMMSNVGAEAFFSARVAIPVLNNSFSNSGLEFEIPKDWTLTDVTDGILIMGEAAGVSGYIGPATRPEDLKRYRSISRKPIWCPGFGRQDRLGRSLEQQFHDWARIVGPKSAAIVGSSIYEAPNPAEALDEIIQIRDRVVKTLSSN